MNVEPGTRGARGERLIYSITEKGRTHFYTLLREILLSYELVHIGIETAVVFLSYLTPEEGVTLLQKRREAVQAKRAQLVADGGDTEQSSPLVVIASDHLISLIDAELAWIDRSLAYLQTIDWADQQRSSPSAGPSQHGGKPTCPGTQHA